MPAHRPQIPGKRSSPAHLLPALGGGQLLSSLLGRGVRLLLRLLRLCHPLQRGI